MPEISVIIPVYKVEEYLPACLDSLLAQTFTDFECILVDDGSPDNCPALCDAYAAKDKRFKVIHQEHNGENKGASGARNTGIEHSSSPWIAFIDGDDIVHQSYLSRLYSMVQRHHAQMVWCNSCSDIKFHGCINEDREADSFVLTGRQALSRLPMVVWGKLYSRQVIGKIRFPMPSIVCEDEYFNSQVAPLCQKVIHLQQGLYYYRTRANSIVTQPFFEGRIDSLKVTHDIFFTYAGFGYTELLPMTAKRFWNRFYRFGRRAVKAGWLTPRREVEIRGFCHDIIQSGYPPTHPIIWCMARLFMSERGRPLFYWLAKKV